MPSGVRNNASLSGQPMDPSLPWWLPGSGDGVGCTVPSVKFGGGGGGDYGLVLFRSSARRLSSSKQT